SDFEQLKAREAIFIEDPSLRGPHFDKSLNELLKAVFERYVSDDPSIELVYLIEYDHLILRADFELRLTSLADRSGAGFLGKTASARNDSNWPHFLKA